MTALYPGPGRVRVVPDIAWILLGTAAGLGILFGLGIMHGADDALAGTTVLTPATCVAVAALCYLAAGTTGARWVAWAALPIASTVPFLGLLLGIPWWLIVSVVGVALVLVGLRRRRQQTLTQTVAMLAYLGLAVVALFLTPTIGLAVAGAALAAHAAWDLRHLRNGSVVPLSFAVWCCGLDISVGGVCLALAILG